MRKRIIACLILITFLLTGCWDQVEIEDRAHIAVLGIDRYTPSPEEDSIETPDGDESERFVFTLAYPKHNIEELSNLVVSTVGESLYGVSRVLANRTNDQIYLGHLRAVVLNSDIVSEEERFRQILNGIENAELLSRRVILLMTDESAADVINTTPDSNPLVGQYISEIFSRKDRTPRVPNGSVGNILKDLHETGNTLIPRISSSKTDIKLVGAAVISNLEFIGWLDEENTSLIMIFKGEAKTVGARGVDYNGINIPLDMRPERTKLRLVENEDRIKIVAEIEGEADIKQTYFEGPIDTLDPISIKGIERAACNTLKEEVESAVSIVQNEFKTDVLNIDRFLRQYHYNVWKELEDNWDEIFPDIDIEVQANIKIRRVGLTS